MDAFLKDYLEKNNIFYVLHAHRAVHTVAESEKEAEIRNIPGLRCKTLFLKDEKGAFYLVGLPGAKRLDYKKLQEEVGVKKITMGSPEELLRQTGLVPGSVSIFGAVMNPNVVLILDREVWSAESVGFHPNINTETLELAHTSLVRYYESLSNKKYLLSL